jgi:cation diffusion facilitator family transporter
VSAGAGEGEGEAERRTSAHRTPAYRRALWMVVLLNAGYGVVEMTGGFLAGSQALKADALDFLGDGLITFVGLAAIAWSAQARARVALAQGVFLGAMGVGVLASTAYRILVQGRPEAELMGVLGAFGLLVNVAAAAVLVPHRTGDVNVRAVWLCSRNDAIGNAAVVVAALLVAWTRSAWPDLVVAAVIAALFLHSSWRIVGAARRSLRAPAVSTGAP